MLCCFLVESSSNLLKMQDEVCSCLRVCEVRFSVGRHQCWSDSSRRARRQIIPPSSLVTLQKRVAETAFYCAQLLTRPTPSAPRRALVQASTFLSCAFCEQEGHLAALPHLLQVRSFSLQGWGLIDLPLRASNEGSPRPRVARAQKIIRLHPLLSYFSR